jgi:hypothetical protein
MIVNHPKKEKWEPSRQSIVYGCDNNPCPHGYEILFNPFLPPTNEKRDDSENHIVRHVRQKC